MKVQEVFEEIKAIDADHYLKYWASVTPSNDTEHFQRWLFAFMSVHTTWESNVKGYAAVADWAGDHDDLLDRLISSRCGLHNNRAKWIYRFHQQYWDDPKVFQKQDGEPWRELRNRLMLRICGLGLAKTSFALELAYPLEAQTTCLDVHMLRLYGVSEKKYHEAEADWLGRSSEVGLPPYIARCAYWDKLQGQPDSRYWSHVLEKR
jgi:endonuclease III